MITRAAEQAERGNGIRGSRQWAESLNTTIKNDEALRKQLQAYPNLMERLSKGY